MSDARAASAMDHTLGRKLRSARTHAGLSQQALADRLGITFQQIQKYEKGANRIAASRLVSIAAALDQPISYFLDETKDGPAARGGGKATAEIWTSPEQVSLASYFASIQSAKVRRRVVDLLRAIIEADSARRELAASGAKRKARKPAKRNSGRSTRR